MSGTPLLLRSSPGVAHGPAARSNTELVVPPLPGLPRRQLLAALPSLLALAAGGPLAAPSAAAAASAAADDAPAAAVVEGPLALKLRTAGDLRQPGLQPPWAPKQLYFPRWMFGEWEVTMRFEAVRTPLGRRFVPEGYLTAADATAEEGGLGSMYTYRLRFYSTLPPTFENELRVNLGLGMPVDAIIGDRAYNTQQTTNAMLGYQAVESVQYDPTEAPLRQTVTLSKLGPDTVPLPPRRLELYINALASEEGSDGSFYTSELCRQVMLGVRQAEVSDYEITHKYERTADGKVSGLQRSALYLQPQQPLFFQAGGRAVAVYDYSFSMKRVPPPEDAYGASACVPTPKSVTQCV